MLTNVLLPFLLAASQSSLESTSTQIFSSSSSRAAVSRLCPSSQPNSCDSHSCYDPSAYTCCPNESMLCPAGADCVISGAPNDKTQSYSCCPTNNVLCGHVCIDRTELNFGGSVGMCGVGEVCCGYMCCDEGDGCAEGSDGPRFWVDNSDLETSVVDTAPATSVSSVQGTPSSTTKREALVRHLLHG